ncbi:hypothetical protein BD410DRAFT_903132 [Rickenella mellea]|uniref:Uncharacterized protein n=1 Tax=Rickenella mellea TaxID=50990 RepID=A0A4Y7PI89_9AGAM|nr:hypothetical protein BD410DRAFT_903132 [Rickenella mellea]
MPLLPSLLTLRPLASEVQTLPRTTTISIPNTSTNQLAESITSISSLTKVQSTRTTRPDMPATRSQTRGDPSASSSSSAAAAAGGSVSRVIGRISTFVTRGKRVFSGGNARKAKATRSRSRSPARSPGPSRNRTRSRSKVSALAVDAPDAPAPAAVLPTEQEEQEDLDELEEVEETVNNNDAKNNLDDGDEPAPADATVDSPSGKQVQHEFTADSTHAYSTNTKDASPTATTPVGRATPTRASPTHIRASPLYYRSTRCRPD